MSNPDPHPVRLPMDLLEDLCSSAVIRAGGSAEVARALASATVAAERRGKPEVGVAHLRDYLTALREGRLNGHADPRVVSSRGAVISVNADEGPAQLAFERARADLLHCTRESGVGILSVSNAFSAGELGYYSVILAEAGFIALACANSPALMSVFGSASAIAGTNPLSFALPHPSGPRLFDQASSAAAWVKVREASVRGDAIPEGWAQDAEGAATTDADAALLGAMLPFGGAKGANIAMMVEMLAALSGGSFSTDAAPFDSGNRSPRLGLFVLAIDPTAFDPQYAQRTEEHLQVLARDHGADFGRRRPAKTKVELTEDLYATLTTS